MEIFGNLVFGNFAKKGIKRVLDAITGDAIGYDGWTRTRKATKSRDQHLCSEMDLRWRASKTEHLEHLWRLLRGSF